MLEPKNLECDGLLAMVVTANGITTEGILPMGKVREERTCWRKYIYCQIPNCEGEIVA
jgi:hypothetical protein